MATVNGTPVNFTFGSSTIAFTNLTGTLVQGIDYGLASTRSVVKNQNGDRVTSAHCDQIRTATIEWIVSGTTMATAITNTVLNVPGTYIVITSCLAIPEMAIGGTAGASGTGKWEVISCRLPGKNDDVMRITIEIEYAAGITTFPATPS